MSNGTKEASQAVKEWAASLVRRGVANVETKLEANGKVETFTLTATLHNDPPK